MQDMLDSILQLAYPYISQGNGWTDLNNKIQNFVAKCKLKVEVNPKYLPMGEENKTQVIIGKTESEIIRCYMWKDEDFVFTEHGGEKAKVKCAIDKLSSVCYTFPCEKYLVLFSANTLKCNAVIGQYEYGGEHNGHPYYKQKGRRSFYLYYGNDNQWYGSFTLGDTNNTILYNPHPYPRDGWKFTRKYGWMFSKGNDSILLTLTPGQLTLTLTVCCITPFACEKYMVLSSANTLKHTGIGVIGQYEYGGEHNGHPYYKQMGCRFCLYYGTDNQWHGSFTLGDTDDIFLYNPHPDPRDGWKISWGNDSATLTLTPGQLTPCRLKVTLAGEVTVKFAECQGVYTFVNFRWWYGRPMYTNSSGGQIWLCGSSWRIEPSSRSDAFIRPDTDEDVICAASVTKWIWTLDCYADNVKWKHADVSITCSVH